MKLKLILFAVFIIIMGLSTDIYSQKPKKDKQHGPPSWAPAHGYRAKTRHVYFPEYNLYYDTQKGVYISYQNGKWGISAKLPLSISEDNLKAAVQVELELNTDSPQNFNSEHKEKYASKTSNKGNKDKKDKPKKHK